MVLLRRLLESDAPALHALIQANREHLSQHGDYSDLLARTPAGLARQLADEESWGVHAEDTLCGCVTLIRYEPTVYGLGYWIAAAAAGQGFMTEAVARAIDIARTTHGARTFWAGIRHGNSASIALVKRLGFQLAREQETHLSYCLSFE